MSDEVNNTHSTTDDETPDVAEKVESGSQNTEKRGGLFGKGVSDFAGGLGKSVLAVGAGLGKGLMAVGDGIGKGAQAVGSGIKNAYQGAVDNAKEKEIEKQKRADEQIRADELQEHFDGGRKSSKISEEDIIIRSISIRNALKIIYYLMAADGNIFHSEEEKFDSIGKELDPSFHDIKDAIVQECKTQLNKVIDPEDYFDVIQDGIEEALLSSAMSLEKTISPKLLVWDLLTIAYSDESYDEAERKLIKYIVRKTEIDKAVFLELESSILTLMELEKEITWLKSTERPYLTIEAMLNEIADRKNVIFESVKDLITL